jgi:O-antigen ligase
MRKQQEARNLKKTKSQRGASKKKEQMLFGLNIDLRPFFLFGLFLILFFSPFMRGLFFPPEFLPACILVGSTFIICVFDQVLRREIFVPRLALDWAVIAFVLAWALSLIGAVHMVSALRELMEAAACAFLYICALRAARDERSFDLLLIVCYLAGIGVALIGVLAAVGVFPFPGAYHGGRLMSTFQYPNSLAVYLLLLNCIGLTLSVKRERLLPKIFYSCGNFLMILVILGTQSRGGWVVYPLAVGSLIALIPAALRWRAAYHLVIPLGCALFASRGFFGMLRAGESLQAGQYVVYGAVAAAALQAAYHFLALWLNRDEVTDATRRLAAAGGVGYLALVTAFYVYSSAGALPIGATAVAPAEVVRRAEQISAYDVSFQGRLEFSRDALKIVRDHPIIGLGGGGWNALYHKYQSSLYWTTETHNHFFQTWVEAGTLGFLALLGVWVGFAAVFAGYLRRHEGGGMRISASGAAVGAFALGLHSAFDFDLSLPALSFLLFALFGAVRGALAGALEGSSADEAAAGSGPDAAAGSSPGRRDGRTGLKAFLHRLRWIGPQAPAAPAWLIGATIIGLAAGLALIIPARNFYAAGTVGAVGARALLNKDLETAERCYAEAHRLDPFTASYAADLAQIYAAQSLAGDDAIKHYRAIKLAREAAEAEPYNAQVRAVLVNVYLVLREPLLAAEEAEALLDANPMLASNYELVAAARLEAARYYLRLGKADLARPQLRPVDDVVREMEKKGIEVTPRFRLYQGALAAVAGRLTEALAHLEEAAQERDTEYEAKAWLAAALEAAGDSHKSGELASNLREKSPQFHELYEALRKESSSWPSSR